MSDLNSIQPKNRQYEIVNPATEEPIGLIFTLRPPSCPEVKRFEKNWTDQQLRKRGQKLSADGIENRNIGRVVASVEGWEWRGDANWQGSKPEFTQEKLREVLKVDWIFNQLNEEVANEQAFFRN